MAETLTFENTTETTTIDNLSAEEQDCLLYTSDAADE